MRHSQPSCSFYTDPIFGYSQNYHRTSALFRYLSPACINSHGAKGQEWADAFLNPHSLLVCEATQHFCETTHTVEKGEGLQKHGSTCPVHFCSHPHWKLIHIKVSVWLGLPLGLPYHSLIPNIEALQIILYVDLQLFKKTIVVICKWKHSIFFRSKRITDNSSIFGLSWWATFSEVNRCLISMYFLVFWIGGVGMSVCAETGRGGKITE